MTRMSPMSPMEPIGRSKRRRRLPLPESRSGRPMAILIVATAILTTLGWLVAGSLGAFWVPALAAAAALLLLRLELPAPRRRRRLQRPGRRFDNREFPAYRRIEESLMWSRVSARHFDHAALPLLGRIVATQLAERRGIDPGTDPAAARAALGDEAWELVDPDRPISADTTAPGVTRAAMARLTDRLEQL